MRADLSIIKEWVEPGSRVLDLGCGVGVLLVDLLKSQQVTGYGLEIDSDNIVTCIGKGLNVIQADLDKGLSSFFDDGSFDYVFLTHTLQAIQRPLQLMEEMLAVGKQGIVTFPNMGFWRNRVQLLFKGRMPVTKTLPYSWYDTPNIHLCTLRDFERICEENSIQILQKRVVNANHKNTFGTRLHPNLMAQIALYRLAKK